MNQSRILSVVALLASGHVLGGCVTTVQDESEGSSAQAQEALEFGVYSYDVTGFLVQTLGRGLNGRSLNGTLLDGRVVKYASLDGARLGAAPLTDVTLEATVFAGRVAGHKKISGRRFEGVVLPAVLDDGSSVDLQIDAISPNPDPANKDVNLFQVSYATTDGQKPLCGTDADGQAIAAIPLSGRPDTSVGVPGGGGWVNDPGVATFACLGYAVAKCVEFGYKPWREGKVCVKGGGCTKITFADHFVACTRMLRADYCGDGQSHTVDGTEINFYDAFGIQLDGADWPLEAEWTASGARCAVRPRVESLPLPWCWASLQDDRCGDVAHYADGTLLMSEVKPTGM